MYYKYFLHHCKNKYVTLYTSCVENFNHGYVLTLTKGNKKETAVVPQTDQWTLGSHASLKCASAKFVNAKRLDFYMFKVSKLNLLDSNTNIQRPFNMIVEYLHNNLIADDIISGAITSHWEHKILFQQLPCIF